jgi:MFS family permease
MVALFMAALDQTIVGTAMPRIVADLRGFDLYAWTVSAYLITSTAVVPIFGKLGDLFGRKRFLLTGVGLFITASVLCGLSQSMLQLIAFRALQGVGAGLTFSMAFTTIADLFPPARRARISGIFTAVFGMASILGPALGGVLTDGPGWRWVFYINIPIGLAALAALYFFYPAIQLSRHSAGSSGASTNRHCGSGNSDAGCGSASARTKLGRARVRLVLSHRSGRYSDLRTDGGTFPLGGASSR